MVFKTTTRTPVQTAILAASNDSPHPPGIDYLNDDDLDVVRGGMVLMNATNNANAAAHGYDGHAPNTRNRP